MDLIDVAIWKRGSRGQCLWKLDPKRRNLLVQLASVGSVTQIWRPKLLESAGLLVGIYRRSDWTMLVVLDETIYPGCRITRRCWLSTSTLVVYSCCGCICRFTHDMGMLKWTTRYKKASNDGVITMSEWVWSAFYRSWRDFFPRTSWIDLNSYIRVGYIQI